VIVRTLETKPPDVTLEFAQYGTDLWAVGLHGTADMARLRRATASAGDFQTLNGSRLRRQGSRRCRPLCDAAGILGRKTDIMTRDSLHKMLREKIESTAVRVF